jgi:hypothetical protein
MSDKEPNEEVLKWQLMMKAAVDFSVALCVEMQTARMSMAIVSQSWEWSKLSRSSDSDTKVDFCPIQLLQISCIN